MQNITAKNSLLILTVGCLSQGLFGIVSYLCHGTDVMLSTNDKNYFRKDSLPCCAF